MKNNKIRIILIISVLLIVIISISIIYKKDDRNKLYKKVDIATKDSNNTSFFDKYNNTDIFYVNRNGIEMTERDYYFLLQFYHKDAIENLSREKFDKEINDNYIFIGTEKELENLIMHNLKD